MAARVEPALSLQIDSGNPGPFGVAIEFAQTPGDELAALGLRLERGRAVGRLMADQIRALARSPHVISIGLAPEAAAPGDAPLSPKIGPRLASALRESGEDMFRVIVSLRGPLPGQPEIPGLSVQGDMGKGRLDREAIERLAALDAVASIEMPPEFAPAGPRAK